MARIRFAVGDLVSPSDRENFGTICAEYDDGSFGVHFVSPEGHTATKRFNADELKHAGNQAGKAGDRNGKANSKSTRRNGKSTQRQQQGYQTDETELPHDETAEGMALFTFIKFEYARPEMAKVADPDKFYSARNRLLMQVSLDLYAKGCPIELESIGIKLRERGELDDRTIDYLTQNYSELATGANWKHYWDIVVKKAALREIIYTARQMLKDASAGIDPADILDDCRPILNDLPAEASKPTELVTIDNGTFLAADLRQEYLVEGQLVAGQNCIIAGKSKTCKTTIALEITVSLATGTPVFDTFVVPKIAPTMILSGESGALTLRETLLRIYNRKDIHPSGDHPIHWGLDLPKIYRQDDCDALDLAIEKHGIKVCVIDPAYLCLLDVSNGNQASNVFSMGAHLSRLSEIGQRTGCTMVLIHHLKKGLGESGERFTAPSLEDIAMAGFAEWARSWILLARREAYVDGSGEHALWMRCGGSAGHSSLHALTLHEGRGDAIRGGRYLESTIESATEAITREKEVKISQKDADDRKRVLDAMGQFPRGATKNKIRDTAGMSGARISSIIDRLLDEGLVEEIDIEDGRRTFRGFRLSSPPKQPNFRQADEADSSDSPDRPRGSDEADGRTYISPSAYSVSADPSEGGNSILSASIPSASNGTPAGGADPLCGDCRARSLGGLCEDCNRPTCFACKISGHKCPNPKSF